jgi:lipoic acid synthetase
MILGDICTRACAYCAVTTGRPLTVNLEEPKKLAEACEKMGLRYAVITSVNRDDLPDGGASIFAQCIREIRKRLPSCKIEVLIPDFCGNQNALQTVMTATPDTLNHNIETVRRIFHRVRPKGDFDQSLKLLADAKRMDPTTVTKSGIMVGLGETWEEIIDTMKDLRSVDCDLLTIGQYLRPSEKHIPLSKWYSPDEFDDLSLEGKNLGFRHVASGPLVRSSYHADEQHSAATLVAV